MRSSFRTQLYYTLFIIIVNIFYNIFERILIMKKSVSIKGRLTFDPELRITPTGIAVTRFQIASDRPYKNKDGEYKADFVDVVAWRKTADFVSKYFKKGDMISLTGRIETNNYSDKEGNSRKTTYIRANEISFCGYKKRRKRKPSNLYEANLSK